METLYFTRQFTKGNLKGLVHLDSITCRDVGACVEWLKAVTAKGEKGKIDYIIIDHSFQNYKR